MKSRIVRIITLTTRKMDNFVCYVLVIVLSRLNEIAVSKSSIRSALARCASASGKEGENGRKEKKREGREEPGGELIDTYKSLRNVYVAYTFPLSRVFVRPRNGDH